MVVGSGAHSCDAAAIRSAVAIAVPEGASIFSSWCSSMISAVSKYGAASSAKRIISTALIAKLGTMTAFDSACSKRRRSCFDLVSLESARADDRVHAVVGAPREVLASAVDHGEVDRDLGAGVEEHVGIRCHVDAGATDTELPEVDACVVRVDRGHELELGVVDDRAADRGTHAAAGAEHADLDHLCPLSALRAGPLRPRLTAAHAYVRRGRSPHVRHTTGARVPR